MRLDFKEKTFKPPVRPFIIAEDPPKPFIKSINPFGVVRIEFTKSLLIPTFALYPEFETPDYMRPLNETDSLNSTSTRRSRMLKTKTLSEQDQAIEIINRGIVVVNNTEYPLI